MPTWKKYKLGEVAEITSSKRIYRNEYVKEGIPFFRGKEIIEKSKKQEISTDLFISVDRFIEIREKFGSPGDRDLLLSSVGTIGVPYLVKDVGDFYFKDGNIIWFRNYNEKILPEYLYYWIKSNEGQIKIKEITIGSTQQALTIVAVKELEITLPPLPIQHRIAEILGALDDKIELNLQMNKTLEEMAMALYKNWFVDFGPFKDGEFVDSELGMIPKGWEVDTLSEIGILKYGTMPKREKLQENGYPVFSGYKITGFYPEYNCEKDKTIVVARGVGGTGDVKRTSAKCYLTNIAISIDPHEGILNEIILYYFLINKGLHYLRTGSAQPQITIRDLNSIKILIPTQSVQNRFLAFFKPIDKKVEDNNLENQSLTKTRDYLLPKLISGEIEVKIAEKEIKEIV